MHLTFKFSVHIFDSSTAYINNSVDLLIAFRRAIFMID